MLSAYIELSYAELHARANCLAQALREHAIGRDVIVGVCMHRSVEMVVALLGIVKAGAAYLPLDPDLPAARLAFMLHDAKAPLVLTQAALHARLPQDIVVRTLDRDNDWLAPFSGTAPASLTRPSDLAYVIYTSGSTGTPKGVLVSRRNLVDSTHARVLAYEGAGQRRRRR